MSRFLTFFDKRVQFGNIARVRVISDKVSEGDDVFAKGKGPKSNKIDANMEWNSVNEDEIMEADDDCIIIEESAEEMADERKSKGNLFYKEQNYHEALRCYTEAINLCPNCAAYYGNRAATNMMLNRYKNALEDSRKAVELDSSFVKGHLREGKCHLALGSAPAAIQCYERVLLLEPDNQIAPKELHMAQKLQELVELAAKDVEKGEHRRALFYIERCLDTSPVCHRFKIQKAEALAMLGRYQESQEVSNDVLQRDQMNADAVYVRGLCLYYQDNVEKAFQHFKQVLTLAPDHRKARDIYKRAKNLIAKKEEGNNAFRSGKLQEAYELYSQALSIDLQNKFTNSKLYCNRATVCAKLNKLDQAIEDCSNAIDLDDTYMKAYLRRAKCFMDTECYEEAVRDYDKITKMDKSPENRRLLQEAKLALKRSKRKDFYKILGVAKEASDDEIKKAYKKRALIHHPDRHSHAEPHIQKEEERKFKELGEAYSVLSDAKKRLRYDQGQDLEDLDGPGFDHIDPNQIFQAFFGGSQGFSFGGMGGNNFHHQHQHQHQQFPGGFSFQFG